MNICVHDDNSLSNILFFELDRLGKIRKFIDKIIWQKREKCPFTIKDIEMHLQMDFADFGQPDVLFVITDNDGNYHILVVEVKIDTYLKSSGKNLPDGYLNTKEKGITCKINKQFSLIYRALRAIGNLSKTKPALDVRNIKYVLNDQEDLDEQNAGQILIEKEYQLRNSLYEFDKVRICRESATVELMREIMPKLADFYLVTITTDEEMPFHDEMPNPPVFYDLQGRRRDDFPNVGWLNWTECNKLFENTKERFTPIYKKFMEDYKRDEMLDIFSKLAKETGGEVKLIVKDKKTGEYFHLSRNRNFSYKIRIFPYGEIIEEGVRNKKQHDEMLIRYEIIEKAVSVPFEDRKFWDGFLGKLNYEINLKRKKARKAKKKVSECE
ncbi:MAG: hypothetical protein LBT05_14830 [Planctomycetaceae bacterium]|jgi:hypothetical protein|nr:hypothetical protein [Planctomycetaceae bacterium]